MMERRRKRVVLIYCPPQPCTTVIEARSPPRRIIDDSERTCGAVPLARHKLFKYSCHNMQQVKRRSRQERRPAAQDIHKSQACPSARTYVSKSRDLLARPSWPIAVSRDRKKQTTGEELHVKTASNTPKQKSARVARVSRLPILDVTPSRVQWYTRSNRVCMFALRNSELRA
ncbi:hypothetical protein CYLTODRAFT_80128 [Cylindrobasidium torrendii FP15055 ss-10]|uniref:Uncharacterized protein n=1 Tax=Cylindrobasidium torrendii FP15055 ss-10 TaxID=1314674 RepID=A0A0D7BP63_9AGAR|nr:hypothetical protein CYLTODRAFT_80128 [Cylindrobasidium torrendii FP15055 ss-10]